MGNVLLISAAALRRMRLTGLGVSLMLVTTFSAIAQESIPELVKAIRPAVVTILTYDSNDEPIGQGSGFFIDARHIISNRHVLEGAHRAEIKISDEKSYPVRGIVGEDKKADLIQVLVDLPREVSIKPLKAARILPREGEKVVVVGSPLGLENTISDGIVSAIRDVPEAGKLLQITAPISMGSSGSPVVNLKGEVIGIATLQMRRGQNLNFAVPAECVVNLKPAKAQTLEKWNSANSDDSLAVANDFYRKGLSLVSMEEYKKGLSYFEKAVQKYPWHADAWYYMGFCMEKMNRRQEAVEAYQEVIRIKPKSKDAYAYVTLGMAYDKLGRYEEAIRAYKEAIRIKPDFAAAHKILGHSYFLLDCYQEAVEVWKQVIRIEPADADAHISLGNAYRKLGRYREAIEAYQQAIRIKPDNAEVYVILGTAYLKLARYQEGMEAYRQAFRIKPEDPEIYLSLGFAFLHLGLHEEAANAYKQAIRLKPDYATAHYTLGLTYLILGNRGSALEEYKILKTLDRDKADELFESIYK